VADYPAIRAALATWATTATGLPVYWRDRPSGWKSEAAGYILASISARTTIGIDEVTEDYDPVADTYTPAQTGQRGFTVQFQVRTWRTEDSFDALTHTTVLRDRCVLPETVAAFRSVGIGLASILSEVDLSERQDARDRSIAQIDLRFNAAAGVEGTTYGTIETMDLTTRAIRPDGTALVDRRDYSVG